MSSHSYTTPDEVRRVLGKGLDIPDEVFQQVVETATESIDRYCGRSFHQTMGATRIYPVELDVLVGPSPSMSVGDILPMDGQSITVETTRMPTPDAVWEEHPTGWWLGPTPLREDWPYTEFFVASPRPWTNRYIRITTNWGWPEVPASITRACLMMASRALSREDTPLGQMVGDYGAVYVRTIDPDIKNWIRPYKRAYLLD